MMAILLITEVPNQSKYRNNLFVHEVGCFFCVNHCYQLLCMNGLWRKLLINIKSLKCKQIFRFIKLEHIKVGNFVISYHSL